MPIEAASRHALRRIDEDLLYPRQRGERLFTTRTGIERHRSPTRDNETGFCNGVIDGLAGRAGNFFILTQKHATGGKALSQRESTILTHGAQKRGWKFDKEAATVAGLAVRGDRTPMRQSGKRLYGGFNNPMTRHVIEICNETKAAAVAFEFGVVQGFCSLFGHRRRGQRFNACPVRILQWWRHCAGVSFWSQVSKKYMTGFRTLFA